MAEILSISTFVISIIFILLMLKMFGENGLYVYSTVAVIASNIQILKLTQYTFYNFPIALGTMLFSTTFAVDNILVEHYGQSAAKKSIAINFVSYLFFVFIMQITIWHPEVHNNTYHNYHKELKLLFSPSITILISSLIAYTSSQLSDILIFSYLKKKLKNKFLPFRSFFSMLISTFIDNIIFSYFAWVLLSDHPISIIQLWNTYIFATYILRIVITLLCVPIVRLSCFFIPKDENV